MKKTPLYDTHVKLQAKIAPFAGYYMPIEYSGIKDEHCTVRQNAGIFDVSHMGEIWVKGEKALEFLQKVVSNDVSKLTPGKIQYAYFPNGKGGIVDDLLVYHYSPNKYLLVVNASNTHKDYKWLISQNTENVEIENSSEKIAQIALQGPKSKEILEKITNIDLNNFPSFTFKEGEVMNCPNVIVSTTGYTGAGGYEIYCYNEYVT
ncbi:MAG: glycine cleavage system aminomethyltransferase GcvT, partial [Bacteroidales bacterium]